MTTTLVVGLDGHASGERALDHARNLAGLIGDCDLVVAYIIEWSPFSFQTAEENAARHKRREEEIQTALERVINPAIARLDGSGLTVRGIVRHGDVSDALIGIARQEHADQIIVARASEGGFARRLFGSSTSNLVMSSPVPVTVVS